MQFSSDGQNIFAVFKMGIDRGAPGEYGKVALGVNASTSSGRAYALEDVAGAVDGLGVPSCNCLDLAESNHAADICVGAGRGLD